MIRKLLAGFCVLSVISGCVKNLGQGSGVSYTTKFLSNTTKGALAGDTGTATAQVASTNPVTRIQVAAITAIIASAIVVANTGNSDNNSRDNSSDTWH